MLPYRDTRTKSITAALTALSIAMLAGASTAPAQNIPEEEPIGAKPRPGVLIVQKGDKPPPRPDPKSSYFIEDGRGGAYLVPGGLLAQFSVAQSSTVASPAPPTCKKGCLKLRIGVAIHFVETAKLSPMKLSPASVKWLKESRTKHSSALAKWPPPPSPDLKDGLRGASNVVAAPALQ